MLFDVGCGPIDSGGLPAFFDDWNRLRVDIDRSVQPDIVADLTDLSPIPSGSADAIWAAHCIEHLYLHQVPTALREFRRVLRDDGFICVVVPDLQTVAHYLVADRPHDAIYDSAAGPVTPHDIVFGFGPAIAAGRSTMAHRCGFTPAMLEYLLGALPFGDVRLRRRSSELELVAVAQASASGETENSIALLTALGL